MLNRRQVLLCSLGAATLPLSGCATSAAYVRAEQSGTILRVDRLAVEASGTNNSTIVYVESLGASIALVPQASAHPDEGPATTSYRALLLVCTHRGCNVAPSRSGYVCPCHGSTFTTNGEVTHGPADNPLAELPVELRGTSILIDLKDILETNSAIER